MPTFEVTSPTGSKYDVEVPEGAKMTDAFQEEIFKRISDHEGAFPQSTAGAFGSSFAGGLMDTIAEPVRGAGELFGSEYLTQAGENLGNTARSNFPISPERQDDTSVAVGQALGYGTGQLGLALGGGTAASSLLKGASLATKAKAASSAILAPAFFAGAAGGADESRRLGLEPGSAADKANQVLYGGAELLGESIFGIGAKPFTRALVSDAPNVLLRGARSTAAKRFTKSVLSEGAEEPLTGGMQDLASRFSAEFGGVMDPTNPDQTLSGAELRSPLDPEARAEEFAMGVVGALPFGIHAASRRNADLKDVAAYRARVAQSRKDGEIKPKDQVEIDGLDNKAADYLEKEGVTQLRDLAKTVVEGDAQGIVELKAIINDPNASPAARAAAQTKMKKAQDTYLQIFQHAGQFVEGGMTLDELKAKVPEYENLNPYSKTNQQKQIDASQRAAATAPVQAVAAANAAAGNTATAQALLDTQTSRDKAAALLRQGRAARGAAPVAQAQAPAAAAPVTQAAPVAQAQSAAQSGTPPAAKRVSMVARGRLVLVDEDEFNSGRPLVATYDAFGNRTKDGYGGVINRADLRSPSIAQPAPVTQAQPAVTSAPTSATAPAPVAAAAPAPVQTTQPDAAVAREDQIEENFWPYFESQVNEQIPLRVRNVAQALDEGDFETAAAQYEILDRLTGFHAIRPEIERVITSRFTPEQQQRIKDGRTAAADLAKTVRQAIATKAAEAGHPVALAAAQRIAPKPTQGELSLDPLAAPAQAPAAAVPGNEQAAPEPSVAGQLAPSPEEAPVTPAATDEFGFSTEAPINDAQTDEAFAELEAARAEEAAALPQQPDSPITVSPDVRSATRTAQEGAPVSVPEDALTAVNAELEANRAKRKAALARVQAARGRLGFFGGDPHEQAIANARMFKADVELGYLLLKKGYIRFKIWAREFLRETGDLSSIQRMRRIYRMLRDNAADTSTLINVPEDELKQLATSMDAAGAAEKITIAAAPSVTEPGFFGAEENVMDWIGNTTFFEGRDSAAGAGRSHRIFLDTGGVDDLINPSYRLVYIYENELHPTGDVVTKIGEEWAFNGRASAESRADRFRQYTTTLLDATFTELSDGSRADKAVIAAQTRSQWNAFDQISRKDNTGRLSFRSRDDVARWVASVRFVDGDMHFPVKTGEVTDQEVPILLGGTDTLVGKFHFDVAADRWVFGEGDEFTKGDEDQQDLFQVIGFDTQDSQGRVQKADTPRKVVKAWPVPAPASPTYNVLQGFGPAPLAPTGVRILPAEPAVVFKTPADVEAWIIAKRLRQGHKLDLNAVREYVRLHGPRSLRTSVDKAIRTAEKAYVAEYPEEKTSEAITVLRDNGNLGIQHARFVQSPTGLRPLFTNNVFETAVQINMGYRPEVPANFVGKVHPNIAFDPDTRIISSASDASGKVSNQGDHLAVRQKDPRIVAKSEARMATEDEMNQALLNDFEFVDGLPKAADEDNQLREAQRKLKSMRSPSSSLWDRTLIELVALGNLTRQLRLEALQPLVDATGYSANGQIVDTTKLPQAVQAVRDFIDARRAQAAGARNDLLTAGESVRDVENISVLPNRLEELVQGAAKAQVLRTKVGVNHGAYWNRALRRVWSRYNTRKNSGFSAPVVTVQYNEEGSEQIDVSDEEQLSAALAAGDITMEGSAMRFDDVADDSAESEEAFMAPEGKPAKAVQLDLFGDEVANAPDAEEENAVPDEVEEPELVESTGVAVEPVIPVERKPNTFLVEGGVALSRPVFLNRNKKLRDNARRIMRGLPIEMKEAILNADTPDRLDKMMETYRVMRVGLIRSGLLRSEERPSFIEAMTAVFKNKTRILGFEKMFPPGTSEIFHHIYRAQQQAPGVPKSDAVKEVVEHLGLVSGDPQSAIDALTKIAESPQVDFGTRQLARRLAALPGVQALRQFTMVPTTITRGLFLREDASINVSPQGTAQATAETLLHEFSHLALEQAFLDVEAGTADAATKEAYDTITALRLELAEQARRSMGESLLELKKQAFDNNEEFTSFLMSDPAFNAWVSSRPVGWLTKLVNAIRKFLGLRVPANTTMDKAWRAVLLMAERPAMFAQSKEAVSQQAMELLIAFADVDAGFRNGMLPLMAGVNAQNLPEALKASFAQAQEMSANKENLEKIRKETGWFRAPTDKQWRWEISDHALELNRTDFSKLQEGEALPLELLVSHDLLFQAYPEARGIMVIRNSTMKANGSMNNTPSAFAPQGTMKVRTFSRALVVHELQHWLQNKEGFFGGSSPSIVKEQYLSGELSDEDIVSLDGDPENSSFYETYRQMPGEREARYVARDQTMTPEERLGGGVANWYPVTKLVLKLRELAAKGGIQAAYEAAEDTVLETSTARSDPAWYDGSTDRIYMNPDVIAQETQWMSDKEAQNYMDRIITHENIHRADNHAASAAERDAYMVAMSEEDFQWIANLYYPDPAEREYALGLAPGMSAEEKLEQRKNLMREHRRAMIELALHGETTEQFAIFASRNPGIISYIKRLLTNFIAKLTARVQMRNYNGSARDLRGVMETLNNIEDMPPEPGAEGFSAAAGVLSDDEMHDKANELYHEKGKGALSNFGQGEGILREKSPTKKYNTRIGMMSGKTLYYNKATEDYEPFIDEHTQYTLTYDKVLDEEQALVLNVHGGKLQRYSGYEKGANDAFLFNTRKMSGNPVFDSIRAEMPTVNSYSDFQKLLDKHGLEHVTFEGLKQGLRENFTASARSVAVPILSRRVGTYKVGGWASTGFLNAEAAEAAKVRDAKLRAMQTRVQMHRDDIGSAVKKEYTSKGLAAPDDLINTALGSTENPVSPQQLATAEALKTRAIRNAVGQFLAAQNLANSQTDAGQAAIIRENARKAYKDGTDNARKLHLAYITRIENDWITATRAKQAAAFAALSPETATAVRKIRDDIDAMQQALLASGTLGPRTAARVTKTFGIYLTRSYQVFNESMVTATGVKRNLWTEFLRNGKDPKAQALLDAARAAIFEDAVVEKAKELRKANVKARTPVGPFADAAAQAAATRAAQAANPPLTATQAIANARRTLQANGGVEVELLLEKYIDMGESIDSDTDVLKRRDNIHPAIQALWGVYEENEFNAYNTMMKINTLLASQKMFSDIYAHGKASGYIFDKEGVYLNGIRTVPLGGTGTQANRNRFGILAGTYGPAELQAGLQETFGGNASNVSSLWNFFRAVTGYAMATKTKYSIQGTARNFLGNIMFPAVNMNLHKFFTGKARKVVARQLNLISRDKTAYDNYIKRLIELRVVSESAYEFRDLTREFSQQMNKSVGNFIQGKKALEKTVASLKAVDKFAGRLHQSADDFWKVLSFEAELGKVKAWEPNLTQEQAEAKAAWKIRMTMPTYTETPYFIKRLRQQPFISPFITFTAEMYRVTFGTLKVGYNEMAEGALNGNMTQRVHGLSRIMLLLSSLGAMPVLMAMVGKSLFGSGEDDKEDGINPGSGEAALRRFVPEYMRNSSLMRFKGKDHNEQIYMDASYLIPQDVIGKVLRVTLDAFMKPETLSLADKSADAGLAFVSQVMEPVGKEQLFFGSVMQAYYNYNQAYDRKIYKDTDTPWETTTAIVKHIYQSALEPGTLRTGRLIWEASDGVVRDGMKMEVPNESLGVVGIKKRTIVLDTRFAKNADQHKMKLGEAATYVTTPMQSNSTVSDEDLVHGYTRANEVRMDVLREARRDYLAAQQLGMPQGKAVALLRDSQLSEDDVTMVVGNFYTPYQVSEQTFNKALERSKVVGQDRGRLYLQALRSYPKRQPLIPE